jgi:hypothetical protein
MTNEDFIKIVKRGEQAAFILGQVHGKIHNIINTPSPAREGEIRKALLDLYQYIGMIAGELYYQPGVKNEVD